MPLLESQPRDDIQADLDFFFPILFFSPLLGHLQGGTTWRRTADLRVRSLRIL